MSGITEITPRVSLETRRESAALVIDDSTVSQDDHYARIEFAYRDVYALKSAIETLIESPRFKEWTMKQESR